MILAAKMQMRQMRPGIFAVPGQLHFTEGFFYFDAITQYYGFYFQRLRDYTRFVSRQECILDNSYITSIPMRIYKASLM